MSKLSYLSWIRVLAQQVKLYVDSKFDNLNASVLELQNRFDVLADEYRIYKSVDDSEGATIEDSNGSTVEGKVVYVIK